jgi:hypothetical protein
MERAEDLEDGEMEDREREDGGVANIYDEQSCAGGAAEISAAHSTPSFVPPPLNPYNRLLDEVLMERDEDLEEGRWRIGRERMGGGPTLMMNRAAPEALQKFLLLISPLPSFLLLSTPTTDCWLRF